MSELFKKLRSLKSSVPAGKIGQWEIRTFRVSKQQADFHNLRERINGRCREIEPGTYTQLVKACSGTLYNYETIMSDTPAELDDHIWFINQAYGNVLITGLGLGLVVEGLMLNPEVKHVTVIEIEQDVISLVGPHLKNKFNGRLDIINADAFAWIPPRGRKIYDCAWHDIWPTICGDHFEGMKKLHRKYASKVVKQDSWCREEIKRAARK